MVQSEILMPDEGRSFLLGDRLRCPCGRTARLVRAHGKFQVSCDVTLKERAFYAHYGFPDNRCLPPTGWQKSSHAAVAIWKALKVLSK